MYTFSEVLPVAFRQAVVNSVECAIIGWSWWYGPLIAASFIVRVVSFIFGIIVSNVLTIWAIVVAFQHWGIFWGAPTALSLMSFHAAIVKSARQLS